MNRLFAAGFSVLFSILVWVPTSLAQQEETEGRRLINRVQPQYPEVARNINLSGTVKAEAVVAANGAVKSIEVKGGNPVLVRAAQNAIYKWKWAPATHETREPIEVKFDPR